MIIEQCSYASCAEEVKQILTEQKLPIEDFESSPTHVFIARYEKDIKGVIALEHYGSVGLLRSLAVREQFKGERVGETLLQFLLDYASAVQIEDLFLLTITAKEYFEKKGFHTLDRAQVPVEIQKTTEFSSLCPSSAVVMQKSLVELKAV